MRAILAIVGLMGCALWAQDAKPDLTGTWQLDLAKSEIFSSKPSVLTWLIQEKAGSIEMKQVEKDGSGHERQFAFTCGIGGKECAFKEPDGRVKASFWYNGPTLVEMKTFEGNDHVAKYRMKLDDGGKTLNVELMSIAPASAKPEHLVFSRQQP
jgi:hypothetical protein